MTIKLTPAQRIVLIQTATPKGRQTAPDYKPVLRLLELGFIRREECSAKNLHGNPIWHATEAGLEWLKVYGR